MPDATASDTSIADTGVDTVSMDGTAMDGGLDSTSMDAGMDSTPQPALCKKGLSGPDMVDAGVFCIDSTEVTQAQYLAFLQAKMGNMSGQPIECASWNANYGPNQGCLNQWDPMGAGKDLPMGGVDWCDAYMYCAWAGKRLCGTLADGGNAGYFQMGQEYMEWYSGCSNFNDGLHKYPYGNSFDPYACNGRESEAGVVANVGAFAKCNGGINGLKDMAGNHWEMSNECQPYDPDAGGSGQYCVIHGGSYYEDNQTRPCGQDGFQRSAQACHVGFRCCASN